MTAQTPHRPDGKGGALVPAPARQLEAGEKITTDVIARRFWNNTGLEVTAGQNYQFLADGTWVDWFIPCHADGYPTPWWDPLLRMVQGRRRVPDERYFELVGAVRAGKDCWYFVVGSSREVRMSATGQLAFFANDVPGSYWNNLGSIRLDITRLS